MAAEKCNKVVSEKRLSEGSCDDDHLLPVDTKRRMDAHLCHPATQVMHELGSFTYGQRGDIIILN